MKKILTLLVLLLCREASSQNVAINDNGFTPHPSAMLDISSITKGLLMPRHTTISKLAIASPAPGLMVLDTTTWCISMYSPSGIWIDFCPTVINCPSGMVNFGYFSVEQNLRPPNDFWGAVMICHNLGPRVRLGTVAELHVACVSGLILSMGGTHEWVDDFTSEDNIIVFGGSGCNYTYIHHWNAGPTAFRCVCEH